MQVQTSRLLRTLERFPDWFKAIVLVGAIVIILAYMSQKATAQQEQIVKLREAVAAGTAERHMLKREVDDLESHILRIEGKLDVLLVRTSK